MKLAIFLSVPVAMGMTCAGFHEAAHAQRKMMSNLGTEDPSLEHYLAAKQGNQWAVFPPQELGSDPYELKVSHEWKQLNFRWAAPSYPGKKRQLFFARTRYFPEQEITLHKNIHQDDEERELVPLGRAHDYYFDFHTIGRKHDRKGRTIGAWHGLFHSLNLRSYEVVQKVLAVDKQGAAERLILLKANRKRISWIPFDTQGRPTDEPLTVTLAYKAPGKKTIVHVFRFWLKKK